MIADAGLERYVREGERRPHTPDLCMFFRQLYASWNLTTYADGGPRSSCAPPGRPYHRRVDDLTLSGAL